MINALFYKVKTVGSAPFRYIAKLPLKAGQKVVQTAQNTKRNTKQALGAFLWEKKLHDIYLRLETHPLLQFSVYLLWGMLFYFAGKFAYFIFFSKDLSLFLRIGGAIPLTVVLLLFLSDIRKNILWKKHKRFSAQTDYYDKSVLEEMDKEVEQIVAKYAAATGLGNTISAKWRFQYLIMIFSFVKMILEIAKVYRVSLSVKRFCIFFLFGLIVGGLTLLTTNSIRRVIPQNIFIPTLGGAGAWFIFKATDCTLFYVIMSLFGFSIRKSLRPTFF